MTTCTISEDPASLENQIAVAISNIPGSRPRNFRVIPDSDSLILEGAVDSFFAKQLVQESLRGVAGIYQIDNRLMVAEHSCP